MEETVIAKWDYVAAEGAHQELSMSRNEVLTLLDDSKTWWKVRNKLGKVGYVPSNYIQKEKKKNKAFFGGKKPEQKKLADVKPTEEVGSQCIVVAKFNYEATRDDELDILKGQKILVIEQSEDAWWRGRNEETGTEGWFPSNYVDTQYVPPNGDGDGQLPIQEDSVLSDYSPTSPVLENVRCLYPFNGNNPEELPFIEQEELEILGKPDNDPEWWVARNSQGRIGLVPRIYTEVLDQTYPVDKGSRFGEISHKPWFYEHCQTRDHAEKELSVGKEGDFIVRPSESSKDVGNFSVSVKGKTKTKHFRVKFDNGDYVIGQRKFKDLDKLIENYIKNPIFSNQDERLYLVRALPR